MEHPSDHTPQPGPKAPPTRDGAPVEHLTRAGAATASVAMNAMTELIGVFTHDLSNPLQTIVMQLELLSESARHDPTMHRRVQAIVQASQEFQKQVQNLADYVHHTKPGQLHLAVASIAKLMGPRLAERKITWEPSVASSAHLQGCTANLEFVLIRTLIALAYESQRPSHHPLHLRTRVCTVTSVPPKLRRVRLNFEMRQIRGDDVLADDASALGPVLPIDLPELVQRICQAEPSLHATILPSGQLQIDVLFPVIE